MELSDRRGLWIAVFLAAVFFAQGFLGSLTKSITWDEPIYISAGYTFLAWNGFQLNPTHPPLLQQLVAVPVFLMNVKVPAKDDPTWKQALNPKVEFGYQFLFESGNDVRKIALWARLPVLLMGTGLILAIYLWGRRLYGIGPALVGTAVAAFSPNLLAHAKVATTDLGCTALMFLAVWTIWRSLHKDRIRDWLLCGFVTGLAVLSKYTALLLGPIYLTLTVGFWMWNRETIKPLTILKGFICIGSLAVLTVGADYNFTFDLPSYVKGLNEIYADHVTQHKGIYLLGEVSKDPWWYYHLVAFLVKVPVPTQLLMAMAVVWAIYDRQNREASLFLLIPAFAVIGASFFDKANLGLRRILPALPFLFLFTAQSFTGEKKRIRLLVVPALLCWLAFETLRIYPHHLAYFNSAVGGPERGPYLLDDSNIDWGQDLPALAEWQRKHPDARPLRLSYFGNALPAAYEVESVQFPPSDVVQPKSGFYAISATQLVFLRKVQAEKGLDIDWLTKYKPIARAGYSIYIYRFP